MEVKPFRAFRFDSKLTGDVSLCISPPYDVIDEVGQKKLYEKNPCNIVRIIRGKTLPGDNEDENQYTRAAQYLNEWIKDGLLKADSAETIYAYTQNFAAGNKTFRRSGFIALGKLEDLGRGVQPHEKTLDGPKADRLKLTQATAAQLGQIFMLYDDPDKIADAIIADAAEKPALIDFTEAESVRHRLFTIDNPEDTEAIVKMMAVRQAVIADGHHRYETALNYYNETKNPAAQYRMMTFVNMQNEGLVILPTHRLVGNLGDFDFDKLLAGLYDDFDIVAHAFEGEDDKAMAMQRMFEQMKGGFEDDRIAFGLYASKKAFYVVTLKDVAAKELDVNVLHKLILEKRLGISEKQLAGEANVEYIKDIDGAVDESVARVDSKESQVVFFMNATRIEQVKTVAGGGEKMPQKSTFFYPKIHTGLVINKL